MIKVVDEITKELLSEEIKLQYDEKVQVCAEWVALKYVPIGFAFRTKKDCMYIWTMTIGDLTIVGSRWSELKDIFVMLQDFTMGGVFPIMNYDFGRKLFHYLRGTFGLSSQMTRGKAPDDPFDVYYPDGVYGIVDTSFLFIDSKQIAPMDLKDLTKAYCTTEYKDCGTNLESCIQESIIAKEFSQYVLDEYVIKFHHLPVTQNQIIKDIVSQEFNKNKEANKEVIKGLFPDKTAYILIRYFGFRGGWVLSSDKDRIGEIVCDDLESAYTAAAVHGYFPMTPYRRVPSQYFRQYIDVMCVQLKVTFINLKLKHKWMSYDNCTTSMDIKGEVDDTVINKNGKIIYSPKFTTSLTELDFKLYEKMYVWEKIIVHECWISERGELPDYVKLSFLKLYGIKSALKIAGKKGTPEYARAKTMPSTVFGYTCQKLVGDDDLNLIKTHWYNKFKTKKMMPQWGVYITAHVRWWIINAAIAMGEHDWLYSDTDSLWHDTSERSKKVVEKFNECMKLRNLKLCMKYHLDPAIYSTLGCLDNEGKVYDRFKTIGNKSYIAHIKGKGEEPNSDNYKLILAGVPEEAFWKCCEYYLPHVEGKSTMDKVFNYFTEDSPIIYNRHKIELRFNVCENINGETLYEQIAVHEEDSPVKTSIRQAMKTESFYHILEKMGQDLKM